MPHVNPLLGDPGPDWALALNAALDALDILIGPGATSARPAASTVQTGTYYYDTTRNIPTWSDGSVWRLWDGSADLGGSTTPATTELTGGTESASVVIVGSTTPTSNDIRTSVESSSIAVRPTAGNQDGATGTDSATLFAPAWVLPGDVGVTIGARGGTTLTLAGKVFDDVSSVTAISTANRSGSGTSLDPYVITRVRFTDQVRCGASDSTDLTGKFMKFTFCIFEGASGVSNTDNTKRLYVNPLAPFVTVEDSTIAPAGSPAGTGGPSSISTACENGILSFVPITIRRCDIWGSERNIAIQTPTTGSSLIDSCYIHDNWWAAGKATWGVGGVNRASNVTIQKCYIDGLCPTSNYAGAAIEAADLDDSLNQTGSEGIFSSWTVDANFLDRFRFLFYSTNDTARFTTPFVITNNKFNRDNTDGTHSGATGASAGIVPSAGGARFSGRTPTTQSGNVDITGAGVTF
jgi:hypothetical protein